MLPPVVPAPLRRLIVSCLGPTPIATIADLAQAMGVSGRTLHRLITRRAWPSAAELLLWGRLFRGAVAAGDARALGGLASPAQIAAAAGYHRTDSAARAYRRRAGVGMHAVRLDGPAAVTPAFLRAIAGTPAGAAA